MAQWHYCWRCATTVPMLDEAEWAQIAPLMHRTIGNVRHTGPATEVDSTAARAKFYELTGYDEAHVGTIWHHKLSLYGPPCTRCGRLLRTPNAHFCSGCGAAAEREALAPLPPMERLAASNPGEQG